MTSLSHTHALGVAPLTANARAELVARARLRVCRIDAILRRAHAALDADDVVAGAVYTGRALGLLAELTTLLTESRHAS